ncbi:MAG: c-type cytochrome, partial [Flavobacteriales bacterium]
MKLFSFIILLIAINLTLFYNYSNNSSYETAQSKVLKESIKRGNAVYSDFCINCHLPNGEGVQNIYPPLANSDYLKANRRTSIKGVKYGLKGEITVNGLQYNK